MVKHAEGSTRIREEVRPVSEVYAKHTSAKRDPQSTVQPLVVRLVGFGYRRALSQGSKEQKVSARWH